MTSDSHDYVMRPYRAEYNDIRKGSIEQEMLKDDVWKHERILIALHQRFGAEPQVLHNQLERYFNVLTPQMYLADNGLRKKFKKSPKVLTNPEIICILNEGKPDR